MMNSDIKSFKRRIRVTGILTDILAPGMPAVYLYHGGLIRTATVEAILEVTHTHVCFETREAIYTLSYTHTVHSESKTA